MIFSGVKLIGSRGLTVFTVVFLTNAFPLVLSCILLLNGWTPKSTEERTALADIVFAGYVRRTYKYDRTHDHTYTAEISIIRVHKGQQLLDEVSNIRGNRNVYNISNFGDKVMCYADIDDGETYVFFATTYDGRLSAKYDDIFGAATIYSDDMENDVLEALGWKPWTMWSTCSLTCGQGQQTRKRKCIKKEPGKCDSWDGERRTCNSYQCKGAGDILALLDLEALPVGISKPDDRTSAFTIGPASDLTLPSPLIFPGFWPMDFSIMLTVRPKAGNRGYLLTLANTMGAVLMGFQVGYEPFFEYSDMSGQPGRLLSPSFKVDISDGSWRQIALSVRGQSVTLFLDCEAEMPGPLARNISSKLPRNTVLSLGKPYISDPNYPVFEGDIEQFVISRDPEAAKYQCSPDTFPINNKTIPNSTTAPIPPVSPQTSPTTYFPTSTTTTQATLVLSWSSWSDCSATCGRGVQSRSAFCGNNGRSLDDCLGHSESSLQTRYCYIGKCPVRCRRRCLHGGYCVPPGRCKCAPGYYGTQCQHTSCTPGCYNGGECKVPDVCSCPRGYTGYRCRQAVCDPPCENDGRCVRPSICACPYGFMPPTCKAICHKGCQNGGECVGYNRCQCAPGYMGRNCHKAVCLQHCRNGGRCVAPDTCSCPSGYKGIDCSLATCNPSCLNGGTCSSGHYCLCPVGFYGYRCERELCSSPCLNGGKCVAFNTCSCPRGFTGQYCQKSLHCPHGCQNGGHCTYSGRCRCGDHHGIRCQHRKCRYVPVQESHNMATRRLQREIVTYDCGHWGYRRCTKMRYFYRLVYEVHFKTTYRCKIS